jgi:hypothetical protein
MPIDHSIPTMLAVKSATAPTPLPVCKLKTLALGWRRLSRWMLKNAVGAR